MLVHAVAYLVTAVVLLILDVIWLSVAAGALYRPYLAPLLRDGFDPVAAVLFYVVYVAGIVVFVISPKLGDSRRWAVTARGAFFGLVAYATYDLTNQATLRDWSIVVTVADLCWGTFLTAVAATAGHAAAARLARARRRI